jgi:DNA-binding NarL/FixJ family response regulator
MRVPGDLFAPRAISVDVLSGRNHEEPAESPDPQLLLLAAGGLSLREIARRVGLSHETVRQRLRYHSGLRDV